MGRRIKKYYRKCSYLLLLVLMSVCLTACSGSGEQSGDEQGQKTEASSKRATDDQKKDADKNKKQQSIPEDLLPGGDTPGGGEEAKGQAADEGQTDGSVYDAANSSGSSSSGSSGGDASGSDSQGPGAAQESGKQKNTIDVYFEIESQAARSYGYSVSYSGTLTLAKGSTVYDALAASGMDYSGSSYIASIGGLAEKACGSMSGWKYYVNGNEPGKASDKYTLQDGDSVQWSYVLKP